MQTKIIYEDAQLLIVHKPAGLATQTSRVGQEDVVSELKKYLSGKGKGAPYLGVVHRLDQPVEGLLAFAKTREAAAALTKQLAQGSLHKEYHALVCAEHLPEEGRLENYLVKEDNRARVADEREPDAKKAVLCYRLLREREQPGVGLLGLYEISLETGRFHQIRVQMSHAGLPLAADWKYGDQRSEKAARQLGLKNAALCACRIALVHPVNRKKLDFAVEAPFLQYL